MSKKRYLRFTVVMAAFILLATRSGLAGVTNGEFAYGLDAWTVEAGTVEPWFGEARFAPADDGAPTSTLSQIFTLDPLSWMLSFELRMETLPGGETDMFTASLSGTTFYTLASSGVSGWSFEQTVSYDVSSFPPGAGYELRFSLEHDYTDDIDTFVFLDNVGVSIIPAPSAFLLASVGLGLASWLRRCKGL